MGVECMGVITLMKFAAGERESGENILNLLEIEKEIEGKQK
jgi:hypothetical protein